MIFCRKSLKRFPVLKRGCAFFFPAVEVGFKSLKVPNAQGMNAPEIYGFGRYIRNSRNCAH
jgi:hypothetical protein